jgi:hypothetical protein
VVLDGETALLLFRARSKGHGGSAKEQAGTEDEKRTPMNHYFLVPH